MSKLQIISQTQFYNVPLVIYGNGDNDFFMTREEVGAALEYANPKKAIEKLHLSHADRFSSTPQNGGRFNAFSSTDVLSVVEGGRTVNREMTVYSLKGVMELCRWSRQPKANAFMDFTWDVMERLVRGEIIPVSTAPVDFLERCGVIPPALPEPSDKEVAIQFLEVLQNALASGEYYLLYKHCRKPEPQAGVLLGVYDDDVVTLISSRTYEVYKTVNNHLHIKTLWDKLISSGLALPRIEADRNRLVRGNACCVIRMQRQVSNAISGLSKPLLIG